MAKKKRKETQAKPAAEKRAGGGSGGLPTIPTWAVVGLFVLLTVVLFRAFIFSDQMLFGGDTLGLGYMARAFYADAMRELGTFPRWAPMILGGTPFLEALSGGDSLYPPSLFLLLVMETHRALGWKLIIHILAAGFFMFGWIRALGGSRPAALFAGTAYLVAPFLVTLVHPGHDGKLFVASLAPLLFWMVERHYTKGGLASWAGVGLVVALVLYTTHFQMAYFLFGGVGLYAIFRAVQMAREAPENAEAPTGDDGLGAPRGRPSRGARRFGTFLAASIVGAAAAGVQLLPAVDYVTEHSRRIQTTREEAGETGRAWSSSWSMHPEEAMSVIVPEFAGNNARGSEWTSGTYWGRNATRDNSPYAGLVVLLLAAVSFVGAPRRGVRLFLTGLGLLAFLFALGVHTPVWGLFYALVPGISLFRAPDQVMFLFGFSAITLAALGFDHVLSAARDDDEDAWAGIMKVLWGAAAFMVAFAALASSGILTSIWTSTVYTDIDPRRLQSLEALQPFLGRGAWIGAFLALGTAGLAWAVRRAFLAPMALVVGVVAFAAVDGMRVDASFIVPMDYYSWSAPDPNVQAILQLQADDPEPYRLFSLAQAGQDVTPAMHGIELAAGHHPSDLARYRDLIGMVGSGFPENLTHPNIRQLLNVRYLLWPDQELGPPQGGQVIARTQLSDGRPYQSVIADIGLPRARLVASAVVKNDDEAVPYMLTDVFDPASEVVLAEPSPMALTGGPVDGTVTWDERTPNRLRLSTSSDRDALLVVADNWFPAWQATVDGEDVPVLRAYHTLRAVPVPAGEHTVEMVYSSSTVRRSLLLSVVMLVLLIGTATFGVMRERLSGREHGHDKRASTGPGEAPEVGGAS
jgi:hypothetical protein